MGWIRKGIAAIKKIRDRRDKRKVNEALSKMNVAPVQQSQLSNMGIQPVSYSMGGTGLINPPANGLPALQQVGLFNTNSAIASNQAVQQQNATGGILPWWRGPGGKLQFPWNDPRVPEFLKQFSLDDSYLSAYYRAPKGYVIIRDPQGRPYAVMKAIAQKFGLWSPTAKPPISATDWKHYKRNQTIEKKLLKIAGPALRKKRGSGRSTVPKKRSK